MFLSKYRSQAKHVIKLLNNVYVCIQRIYVNKKDRIKYSSILYMVVAKRIHFVPWFMWQSTPKGTSRPQTKNKNQNQNCLTIF